MPTGMEELRRWSPLLICIVPRPRLVHTPKRVAITLNEEEKVNFKSLVKGFQIPQYINKVARPAKDAVTNEGIEAGFHRKR